MIPITNYEESILCGPKNSRELLNIFDNIHYDISNIYNAANIHEQTIKDNMDALILQNYFLQMKVSDLEKTMTDLYYDIEQKTAGGLKTTTLKFDSNNILNAKNIPTVQTDTNHGFSTIPYKQVNKTSVVLDGKTYIYPSLKTDIAIFDEGNFVAINESMTNLNKIFDGSNSSYWLYRLDYDIESNVEEIYFMISINLPINTNNNPYINTMTINTMPEYSMDLTSLTYNDPTQNNIYTFEYFPEDGIKRSSRHIFTLPDIETYSIAAIFKQPYYFIQNNKKQFYFGIQDIGIHYHDYLTDTAYALSRLSSTKNIKVIHTPEANIAPGTSTNIKHQLSYELFLPDNNGYLDIIPGQSVYKFGEEISGFHNDAYILTKLERANKIVPVINDITVQYATIF